MEDGNEMSTTIESTVDNDSGNEQLIDFGEASSELDTGFDNQQIETETEKEGSEEQAQTETVPEGLPYQTPEELAKGYKEIQSAYTRSQQELQRLQELKALDETFASLPPEVQQKVANLVSGGNGDGTQSEKVLQDYVTTILTEEREKCFKTAETFVKEHPHLKNSEDRQKFEKTLGEKLGWKGFQHETDLKQLRRFNEYLDDAYVLTFKDNLKKGIENETVKKIQSRNSLFSEIGVGSEPLGIKEKELPNDLTGFFDALRGKASGGNKRGIFD